MWGFWKCWSGTVILYQFSYKGLIGLLGFTTLSSDSQDWTQHQRNWICFHPRVEKRGDSAFCSLDRAKWFSVLRFLVLLYVVSHDAAWYCTSLIALQIQTLWSPSGLPQLLHSLAEDAVKLPSSRAWWQRLVHHSLWKIACWQVCFLALYLKMWRKIACWQVCFLALYLKMWRRCAKPCVGVKIGHIYWTYKGRNYSDAVLVQDRKENCQEAEEKYILSNFTIGMPHQILWGLSVGLEMKCAWIEHLEDLGTDGRKMFKRYLKEIGCKLDASGLGLQSNGRTWWTWYNSWVPQTMGSFLGARWLPSAQGLYLIIYFRVLMFSQQCSWRFKSCGMVTFNRLSLALLGIVLRNTGSHWLFVSLLRKGPPVGGMP